MFRMGGTTEGITSGLAPRQGYKDPAGLVEQIQQKKSMKRLGSIKRSKKILNI